MSSPYQNKPIENWKEITRSLVAQHPLSGTLILDAAMISWNRLWNTRIGDTAVGFPLAEINPPATVIGYMFEKLFANELATRLPGRWRGGIGSEKDLHCMEDGSLSVEMKSSGQLGDKIYGNRSYGQSLQIGNSAKKDKSGFYITVNFYGQTLTLLRFGWIDASDWQSQQSSTGQMAGLPPAVYQYKLLPILGPYMLNAPVQLLEGVGPRAAEELYRSGINTIADLLNAINLPIRYEGLQERARIKYWDLQ